MTQRRWRERSLTTNVSDVRKEVSLFIIPCSVSRICQSRPMRAVLI
jgi:hypothetical protein